MNEHDKMTVDPFMNMDTWELLENACKEFYFLTPLMLMNGYNDTVQCFFSYSDSDGTEFQELIVVDEDERDPKIFKEKIEKALEEAKKNFFKPRVDLLQVAQDLMEE